MTSFVTAQTLKAWLHDGAEIALFDVREHGQYGEAHLFYAIPLPYSRLEIDAPRLAPRRAVRMVVYDDNDGVADRAAERLSAIGYTNVHVLQGGAQGWTHAGFTLFAGVNVPSKTFGELVEMAYHTPRVTARELAAMRERGDDVVIVDGRPVSEYLKMTIPSSICCPNGELGLRIRELVPDATTPIVVNCAGRTRSIIGAQTLINLGIPNPVMALENGTQGWYLEDLPLEHGSTRRYPDIVTPATVKDMREASQQLAARFAVPEVDAESLARWGAHDEHSVFLCDVRTPEEFASGSLPGAQHAPGGQLIQATDQYVGVRHARLVLFDADGVRAPIVASWLRQLGHDAYVLRDGLNSHASLPVATTAFPKPLPEISAHALSTALAAGTVQVIDLRPSMAFRRAHLPGATWAIRPRLPALTADRDTVLVADDPRIAALAAADLGTGAPHAASRLKLLAGSIAAWTAAGYATEGSENVPPDADCIDYLFFVHDRHDGNKAAARQYLAWETGLLAQLDAQELGAFRVGAGAAQP
ncbi:rhodanese-like domain-containing protein [Ralstonia chuxiongensis]|uniref:rhodanese-like domain-containing protein n=1 Tax=Ralstonia chuxiongensis TaxID=2957504 RepID=UPI0028F6082B|nr:rhodanese-like domain-containing protein [Ralstonia chuxiongensis]CAJ0770820.1 Thiosulfate sulfurtransferase GlpE [Ralstonia chuxiongensis]